MCGGILNYRTRIEKGVMSLSDLVPYQNRSQLTRQPRRVRRQLADVTADHAVQSARIDAVADEQIMKVQAMMRVGTSAMLAAAKLTRIEDQIAMLVPNASGRVQLFADVTTMTTLGIVDDTARRMG